MSGRLLVIQHEDDAPPAWFGEWLEAAGIELVVVLGHRGDPVPPDLERYDGLLVLGGAMGAYDDARHPWLTATKRLIADTVHEGDKPFLGICLGHQLAAVAVGGTVTPNPAGTTIGITPVGVTDDGARDPLLGEGRAPRRAMHWNDDIVATLPPVHRVLARSPDGQIQAVRYGPNAYGVQFHPEVSPAVFAFWGIASGLAEQVGPMAPRIAAAQDELAAAASELRAAWQPLAEAFAVGVRGPVSRRSMG